MPGLLDTIYGADPNLMLAMGAGLLANRNDLGRGLQAGLLGASKAQLLAAQREKLEKETEERDRRLKTQQLWTGTPWTNPDTGVTDPNAGGVVNQLPENIRPFAAMMGPQEGAKFAAQQAVGPKPTSAMQEWEFYRQQGGDLDFFNWQIAKKKAGAINLNMPKDVTETVQTTQEIARLRGTGNPEDAAVADRLEMNLTFGGKPPESYVKAVTSITDAVEATSNLYNMIAGGRASTISPTERANVAQEQKRLTLAFAELTNRGANFTEQEIDMVNSVIGGDPNNIIDRAIQGDDAFLNRLERTGEIISARGKSLLDAFTRPPDTNFEFPWQKKNADRDRLKQKYGLE